MRWLVAATGLLVFASACGSCVELDRGRQYPCHADSGLPDECPQGFVCALDDRCHAVDAGAPLPCVADSDCLGGWRCLSDKTCHAPDQGAVVKCGSSADCTGGYQCTKDGLCHDATDGGSWPCSVSADCTAGWHCGHEGVCHDPAVARAYPCISDQDCEQGWRCGLEGVCLDSSSEGLRPDAFYGDVVIQRLSPNLFDTPPTIFASRAMTDQDRGTPTVSSAFAWVDSNGISYVAHLPDATLDDGGIGQVLVSGSFAATGVSKVGLIGQFVVYLDTAGTLYSLDTTAPTPSATVLGALSGATSLRTGNADAPYAVLSSGAEVLVARVDTGWSSGPLTVPANAALFGALPVDAPRDFVLAAAEKGLYFAALGDDGGFYDSTINATVSSPTWTPVHADPDSLTGLQTFPNVDCADPIDARSRRFVTLDAWMTGSSTYFQAAGIVEALPGQPDAGRTLGTMVKELASLSASCGTSLSPQLQIADCAPCGAAGTLTDVGALGGSNAVLRCQTPTGPSLRLATTSDCSSQDAAAISPLSADEVATSRTAPGQFDFVTATLGMGSIATDSQGNALGTSALATEGPQVLLTAAGQLVGTFSSGPNRQYPVVLSPRGFSAFGGLVRDAFGSIVVGVHGAPSWAIAQPGRDGNPPYPVYDYSTAPPTPVATIDPSFIPNSEENVGPFAFKQTRSNGSSALVVAAGDKILAADVTGVVEGLASPPSLTVRISPEPFSPITAFTLLDLRDADAGTPYAAGYALTPNGLFFVSAATEQHWTAKEVPLADGEYLSVFGDRAAGRLGLRDGRVFSLPSQVLLTHALPEPALDYGELCGGIYVVTAKALYRALPAGGPSDWQPVSLASAFASAPNLSGARFTVIDGALYLSLPGGAFVRIGAGVSCP